MSDEKPKNIKEYCDWLKDKHGQEITERNRMHYESVGRKLKDDILNGKTWQLLLNNLPSINDKYRVATGYPLLDPLQRPELLIKSYSSFLLKTYRLNVLQNVNWPAPPNEGFLLLDSWFSPRINDIIRTSLTVKYLDGVEFLINSMLDILRPGGATFEHNFEAKMEGYYAAHFYFTDIYEIQKLEWDTEKRSIKVELQITTQLQETIKRLLHKYYEERRVELSTEPKKWQWDYKSMEFSTNYLGHILHYIEGMIVDIREKQKETP